MKQVLTSFALLSAVLLVGAGCATTETNTTNESAAQVTEEVMEKDDAMIKDDSAMTEDSMEIIDVEADSTETLDDSQASVTVTDSAVTTSAADEVMEKEETAVTPGSYVDYDATKVADAAAGGDVVLFFHASWCPSCKTLNSAIEAGSIPDGLTIMKVDYDSATDLRREHGVTYQHTLVQVDSDGEQITKWSGGNTLDSITSRVQ